jgi:outer membrane protein assembly factor BamB
MIVSSVPFLLSSMIWLTMTSPSSHDENQWTRFRGSDGSGIDTNWKDPIQLDASGIRWIADLPGKGNSSPVVWDNKIFVTSSDDENGIGYALAMDQDDGKIIWQRAFSVSELSLHVENTLATSTPAVDASHVYFIWVSKEKTTLTAFSHDGREVWEARFDGVISRHGAANSLMLTDHHVIFSREQEDFSTLKGSWVAVEKTTGKVAWELERTPVKANSFSTPVMVELENRPPQLIFSSQAHGLTSVDPHTGKILWEKSALLPARVVASPICAKGLVVACCKGEAVIYDMDPPSGQLADTARYQLPRSLSPYVPTPIIVGNYLFNYLDNGTITCIELETGRLIWKQRPAGPFFGSPVLVAGYLYAVTKEGEMIVVRPEPTYQLVGTYQLDEGSFSTPAMCEVGMVIRTFSQVMVFGSAKEVGSLTK